MRVLFTFVGGRGHFEPLVPLAGAARAAGHSVVFGCPSPMVGTVSAAGFDTQAVGRSTGRPPPRLPLRPLDTEREDREFVERFVQGAAAYRLPNVLALCTRWRPDILVCDETDFGAVLACECAGLPCVTVLVMAAGSLARADLVAEALSGLRHEHGLARGPGAEMLHQDLVLVPFPPGYRDPDHPLPDGVFPFRPLVPLAADEPAPAWSSVLDAPTLYLTLGTIFGLESGDLLLRVVAALADLPANLFVTVGNDVDPAELGPTPAHVHVARYVPQSSVLPACDAAVSHGGSGSVIGALAHGLPSVLIPLGADQPLNARRCSELGLARAVDAATATPGVLRAAVAEVLEEPGYRRNAERLRDEIAALPAPERAVERLERLVEAKRSHGVRPPERRPARERETRDVESPLAAAEVESFVRDGYVRLEAAIPAELVRRCRRLLWRATKLDPDDPSSWTEPVVRLFATTLEPFIEAMNGRRLHGALDQLVGQGRWVKPIRGLGTFPIRFPSERDPGDAGWHVDGSYEVEGRYHVNLPSRGRALLMLILFSDVGAQDAPTRIRRGSHLRVPPVLQAAGEAGMPFDEVVPQVRGLEDLPVDLATGGAGDVFLCHPFLVHAASWPHRGKAPRFLGQPGLAPMEPLRLSREDGPASPVERAIQAGLKG